MMHIKNVLSASLVSVGVALALTACGGGGDSGNSGGTPVDADVTVIGVDGLAWNAKSYTATSTNGALAILARNESSQPHNLHLVDANGTELPGGIDLPRNGSEEVKEFAITPGEYTIICKIAGHDNMKATLTVD